MDMSQQKRINTYSSNSGSGSRHSTGIANPERTHRDSSEKYSATFRFNHVTADPRKDNYRRSAEVRRAATQSGGISDKAAGNGKRYGVIKSSSAKKNLAPVLKNEKNSAAVSVPVSLRKRLTAQRMPKMQTVEARIVRRFPFKLVFLAVFGTLLFLVMIYNNVQINEKSSDVEALKQKIVEMDETIRKTSLDVERKNDLRVIEERALELGMVKSDQLDKRYITIPSDDKVTIVNDVENEKTFHMTGLFESIRNGFFDIINFFK